MGDRFNIQAGDWDTDANWAAASGGAGGASYPIAGDDAILDDNSGNCTLDANAACDSLIIGQVGALYTGTLDAGASDVAIGSGGLDCSYGSLATLGLGLGTTWTCSGDWDIQDVGSLLRGSSRVTLTGAASLLYADNQRLYRFRVDAGATIAAAVASGAKLRAQDILDVYGALSVPSGKQMQADDSCQVRIGAAGSLSGDGSLVFEGVKTGEGITSFAAGGTITIASVLFRLNQTGPVLAAGTYAPGLFKIQHIYASSRSVPLQAGAYQFSGDFELENTNAGGTLTLDNSNNADFTFQGDVLVDEQAGTVAWTSGTGTITASGSNDRDWDFNGLSVEAIVIDTTGGAKVTLTGNVTTESLTGTAGELDVNGVTLTSSGAVTFASGFVVSALDGSTINADTFAADGQTLTGSTSWNLNCTTPGSSVSNTAIGNCIYNEPGGVKLDASDGTNTDLGGNSGIDFGGANRRRRLLMACGA